MGLIQILEMADGTFGSEPSRSPHRKKKRAAPVMEEPTVTEPAEPAATPEEPATPATQPTIPDQASPPEPTQNT
jgi:hypothetical protein